MPIPEKPRKNEFIDDEVEVSSDEEVSEDELELDEDDKDLDLVDQEAEDLDSEEEEEVRAYYHKQLASEDKRAVLLLREQLEENEVGIGERRRRKFRWQTNQIIENSLPKHCCPDDDDSQEGDEESRDYDELETRLRRPQATTAESTLAPVAGPSTSGPSDINRFLFRDKEVVEALSFQPLINTREEREKKVQRELKRMHQSKSIFDVL